MFLSKVEIVGFKSFAHKTKIDFDKGFTAIVGPNGCGKTNIVDAIRWVLGEQKTSVLRGDKMDSVIFNGSDKRKRLGFAEVSLIIENTKNILPIEYKEVQITRRVFRSGESDYYLNKKRCRLKDITNLLMDSGMGPDAYSVIELSMVNMLLNDKDNYRKKLFEEAAGITTYKARRKESLRKLESTKGDILRVRDILSEVERNVRSLKTQVNRAIRYEKIKNDLKTEEQVYYKLKFNKLNEDKEPLEFEQNELKNLLAELSGTAAKEEAIVESSQPELIEMQNGLARAQEELDKFNDVLRNSDNRFARLTERISSLNGSKNRLDNELNFYDTRISDTEEMLKKVKTELSGNKKEFAKIEERLNKGRDERDKFLSEYQQKKSVFLGKSQQIFDVMAQLSEKVRKRDSIQRETEENSRKEKINNENFKSAKNKLESVSNNKSSSEDSAGNLTKILSDSNNKFAVLDRKSIETKDELSSNEKLIFLKNTEFGKIDTKLSFLRNLVEEFGGLPSAVTELLKNVDDLPGVIGTIGDLISVPKEYRLAVQTALGEQAHFLVIEKWNDISAAVEHLRKSKSGRATFIALDKLDRVDSKNTKFPEFKGVKIESRLIDNIKFEKKYDKLVDIVIGDTYIINGDVSINDNISKLNVPSCRLVNTNGDINSVGFLYTGGSAIEDSVSVVGRKDRIVEFEEEKEKIVQEIEKLKSLNEKSSKTITEYEYEKNVLSDESKNTSLAIEELKRKIEVQNFEINQLNNTIYDLDIEIKKDAESKGRKVVSDELNYDIEVLENVKDRLQEEREKFQLEEEALETERKIIEENFNNLTSKFTGLTGSVESYKKENERLMLQFDEYNNEKESRNKNLAENKDNLKITSKEKDDLKLDIEEMMSERNLKESNVLKIREKLNDLQEKKKEVLDSFLSSQRKITELNSRIQERKEKILSINQELKFLNETLEDKGLSLDNIDIDISERNYSEAHENIKSLNYKVENFGPVNLEALEEYDKEKERFTFLENQLNDLEEAEVTLKETIEKINNTARKRLVDTFEQVKVNFQEIFSSFFDKGKADMVLEEGKDPLDASVEIFAQPFGKNVQSISLFSGGEKALTAIAILFAIYKVKPSPFCILDEVDAPLDDSNISRFVEMLHSFSDHTQFIVVTHNKLSMEAANNMYGVTMEENGISKLVSVKLDGDKK